MKPIFIVSINPDYTTPEEFSRMHSYLSEQLPDYHVFVTNQTDSRYAVYHLLSPFNDIVSITSTVNTNGEVDDSVIQQIIKDLQTHLIQKITKDFQSELDQRICVIDDGSLRFSVNNPSAKLHTIPRPKTLLDTFEENGLLNSNEPNPLDTV